MDAHLGAQGRSIVEQTNQKNIALLNYVVSIVYI